MWTVERKQLQFHGSKWIIAVSRILAGMPLRKMHLSQCQPAPAPLGKQTPVRIRMHSCQLRPALTLHTLGFSLHLQLQTTEPQQVQSYPVEMMDKPTLCACHISFTCVGTWSIGRSFHSVDRLVVHLVDSIICRWTTRQIGRSNANVWWCRLAGLIGGLTSQLAWLSASNQLNSKCAYVAHV